VAPGLYMCSVCAAAEDYYIKAAMQVSLLVYSNKHMHLQWCQQQIGMA
jgi:hypothetical protein